MKRGGWVIIADEDHTIIAATTKDDEGAAWEAALSNFLAQGGPEAVWWGMKDEGWFTARPATDELLHDWARDGIDAEWRVLDGMACTSAEYDEATMPEDEREALDRETAADERYHHEAERDL